MGAPPHLVHLVTHLGKGGAANNVLLSAIGLRKHGFSVSVLHGPSDSPEDTRIAEAVDQGVVFHPIPNLCREISPVSDFRAFGEIQFLLRKISPNLLHTHQSKAGILGRWAAKRFKGLPVVHTPHGHVFYGYFPPWKTRLFIEIERRAARHCDLLIGLTQKEVEDHLARSIGQPSQWRVVHSGIELDEIRRLSSPPVDLAEALRIPADSRVFVSIGRLEPVKGFVDFLPHIRPAFEKNASLHWVILGEGSQRENIQATIEAFGLKKQVHLVGWVDNPHPWLAAADGLLVPSKNEGMGRVVVEGFALGKPVFVASVGSLPEMVRDEDHGILFDWENSEGIGGLFETFIRRTTTVPSQDSVRKETASRYSTERMIDALIDCYQEILR
ncbi:MAG: glycosyltransferase [Candidatus Omnitrophica bacterium]|nr:glycosyltransferase [Candidatus Omnitrophota bacterium]